MSTDRAGFFKRLSRIGLKVFTLKRRQILLVLGYTLYSILMLLLFLYLTFPHRQLEIRLISMLEQTLACQIRVNESQWLFPIGLTWREIHLHPQTGFKGDVVVDQARIKVYLLPLLRLNVQTDFFMEAYGGKVRGSFWVRKREGKINYYFQESAQDLELQAMGLDVPFKLEGRLRLDLEATWQDRDVLRGNGSGTLELLGIKTAGVSLSGVELPDLSLSRIAAKLGLRNGIVTVEDFKVQGPDVEATGQGTLLLRNRWSEGLLNLATKAYLKEELRKKFPMLAMMGNNRDPVEILLKGTFKRPLVSINSVPLNL